MKYVTGNPSGGLTLCRAHTGGRWLAAAGAVLLLLCFLFRCGLLKGRLGG